MGERSALVMVRNMPHYRYHAFITGIERLGYRTTNDRSRIADVVIMWNRPQLQEMYARRHEAAGKPVIIAENGYIGNDDQGHHLFALSLGQHNGAGVTVDPLGSSERWDRLGIDVKPWRPDRGGDILVLPQRGIGSRDVAMPRDWLRKTTTWLKSQPRRVRVRQHPGGDKRIVPIERDLSSIWATVTWGSGAAIKAIVEGVPCFYEFPKWIGANASARFASPLLPMTDDHARQEMLYRVSYAQWTVAEIANGYAFDRLLQCVR